MAYILVPVGNKLVPSGCKCENGVIKQVSQFGQIPAGFNTSMTTNVAVQKGFSIMTAEALKQAIATNVQNPVVANQFQSVDVPGRGAVDIARVETPGAFGAAGTTYSIIFKNDNANPVNSYKIFGDWPGTYAIAQNLVPVPGDTMTINGSAGTLSLSHLTNRSEARPFRVSQLQLEALNSSFYSSNPLLYFDTLPNPQSGVITKQLGLSALLSPLQFNPKIQIYEVPELFDGTNGIRFNIPAGEVVTATFTITSESKVHSMKQLQ